MLDFFERYDRLIIPEPNSGCFLWTGAATGGGHGHGNRHGVHFYAHRAAFESVHGIGSAEGLIVRHWCDTPPCCRPDHLLAGTQLDNVADMIARGRARHAIGPFVHTAVLTEELVIEIRERYSRGETIAAVKRALRLDVKWDTIDKAARGITWSYLLGALPCRAL